VNPRSHIRLVVLHVMVFVLLLVLGGRLWTLQVLDGAYYKQFAEHNRIRDIVVPAVRGQILDDKGRPLVRNRTALVVSVDRTTLSRQADGGRAVMRRLAATLGITYAELSARIRICGAGIKRPCWTGSRYQPIPVDDRAEPKQALQIMERQEDFPGVTAQVQAVREYPRPQGAQAAQVLGYLQPITQDELNRRKDFKVTGFSGADLIGREGLEAEYDNYLRGVPGIRQVNVDSKGRVTGIASEQAAVPGANLVTSIDAGVQATVESSIKEAIDTAHRNGKHADAAAGVVMDVNTGRVVALASYPTYDPSIWTGGISQNEYDSLLGKGSGEPLISRATQGQFAPGSTFKISSLAAAIGDGYNLHGTYECPGSFMVGSRAFRNFEGESPGNLSLHQAIVVSCDTIFYRFAYEEWQRDGNIHPVKDPKDPMVKMAKNYGFGTRTGIDLPSEVAGRIPDRAWKLAYWNATRTSNCKHGKTGYPNEPADRNAYLTAIAAENCVDGYVWRAGDAANFAVGQGDVLVTPLQLARAYAAVANGGKLVVPRIARAIVRPDGTVVRRFDPLPPTELHVPQNVLDYLRSALAGVPVEGTARGAFADFDLKKVPVGGKTGTAEVYGKDDTSWFASFAPADKPRLVTVVMVSQGGQGAMAAAPAVDRIWQAIFGMHGQQPLLPGGALPNGLPAFGPDRMVTTP
jgi:penicillin-binding protein 2